MKSRWLALGVTLLCLICPACLSWNSSWHETGRDTPADARATTLEHAHDLTRVANDAERLQESIDAYERVLETHPAHREALVAVADQSILMATAYTPGKKRKKQLFGKAMEYSALAMYTNPEFQALVDQGETPWEASRVLTGEELDAMHAWVTAVLYYFKEAMGTPARIVNIRWIKRLEPVLTRMEQIDEGWIDGAVDFNWGFYYFALPKSMGGNRDTAAEKFDLAREASKDRMYARWGRAKFFSLVTKNKEEFRRELEWIAAQDPSEYADPPPWKAYFQADARKLLQDVDGYFKAGP